MRWSLLVLFLALIVASSSSSIAQDKPEPGVKDFSSLINQVFAPVTDKLRSYNAAKAEVLPSVEHQHQQYGNNRAENSHQPTRLRERLMRRFKSPGHAQRFLSVFGIIASNFRVGRHKYSAGGYRAVMRSRFTLWEVVTGAVTNPY